MCYWRIKMKKDLSTLTDDELLFESDEARSNVSYYNAAEGDNWYREAEAREKAKQYLSEVWKLYFLNLV